MADIEKAGAKKAKILANNVAYVRDLINEPAEKITPLYLAKEAKKIKAKVKVLGKKEILKLGMGGLEAVSRGGGYDPKLILIEYNAGKGKPLALVGKGITFDSGGLNIKPYAYMEDMRSDMGGAATVLGIIKAASELGIKKNIVRVRLLIVAVALAPGVIFQQNINFTIDD